MTGGAAATHYTVLYQNIESVRRLSGKTVTVSFWAIASAALKLGVSIDQQFGVGGSPSAAVLGVGQAVTVGATWARYSVIITLPSISGKTLGTSGNDFSELNLWLSAGTNSNTVSGNVGVQSGTFRFWGVQLEIGSVATPLEKPDPQQDLAKCQRFYQVGYTQFSSYGTAGMTAAMIVPLPVQMRALPTIVPSLSGSSNVSASAVNSVTPYVYQTQGNVIATGGFSIIGAFTASADL